LVKKRQALPSENELVICTITKVFSHGAFASLDEYEGKAGFIHISEIASTWIKNIRDFVREGQKTVAKVLSVDVQKEHVDISTRRVGDAQKKTKMQEWKRAQKAEKLLEIAAKKVNKSLDDAYSEVGFKLEEKYGEIYAALEEITTFGREAFSGLSVPEYWIEPVTEIARENVALPLVNITGYLDLTSLAPNGIEIIKEVLISARNEKFGEDVKLDIRYVGSPRYRINVTAPDYKAAEESLKKCAEKAIAVIEEKGGSGKFLRDVKEEK
jgi:translation initiation factor 2 subunit 1